jgi:hypothetical protein
MRKLEQTYRYCRHCQATFVVSRQHPTQKYCSSSCANKFRAFLEVIPCPVCKQEFYPLQKRTTYCSRSCSGVMSGRKRRATGNTTRKDSEATGVHTLR